MGINLDKARDARREAMKKRPQPVIFGGEKFELPLELPIAAVELMTELGEASKEKDGARISVGLTGIPAVLFSAEDAARFTALNPSLEDLAAIIEGIPAEYGFEDAGKSKASGRSSGTTSARSRRASKPSTG